MNPILKCSCGTPIPMLKVIQKFHKMRFFFPRENAIIENIFFNFLKKLMKIFQALKSIGSTDVISDKARQAMINGI